MAQKHYEILNEELTKKHASWKAKETPHSKNG